MKYLLLLLVGILAAFGNDQTTKKNKITVTETAEGITLTCEGNSNVTGKHNGKKSPSLILHYHDDNTGEYYCDGDTDSKIYVKFRTCDNCVELDAPSIAGLAVGDVVATIVVGVAVYLIASQARAGQVAPIKKRSENKNSFPRNERSNDDNYQKLRYNRGQKDEYDKLNFQH